MLQFQVIRSKNHPLINITPEFKIKLVARFQLQPIFKIIFKIA
jgi:hypothetical protein